MSEASTSSATGASDPERPASDPELVEGSPTPTPRRRLRLVGIGCGDPDQLTLEAVRALQDASFALVTVKREHDPLADVRRAIIERHAPGLRVVEVVDPERDRSASATATIAGYENVVDDWHEARAEAWEQALLGTPGGGAGPWAAGGAGGGAGPWAADGAGGGAGPWAADGAGGGAGPWAADEHSDGALLVWGDPAFYDSTIRVVERVVARGAIDLEWDVLPGISALQLLAARHRVVLHEVGQPVLVTTARRLREAVDAGADNLVVMLGAGLDLTGLEDWTIWWGANLGARSEALVHGRVADALPVIETARAEAKATAGWVMDVYLLRR